MIIEIKKAMQSHSIDFLIIKNTNRFFLEYLNDNEKFIELITNFTGSNATIIITLNNSYFFTDGRYTLQASGQIDLQEFTVIDIGNQNVNDFLLEKIEKLDNIAINSNLLSVNEADILQKIISNKGAKLTIINDDFLNKIIVDNIKINKINNKENNQKIKDIKAYFCNINASGEDCYSKITRVIDNFHNFDAIFITKPEDLCWLINIRGNDLDFTPLFTAFAILTKNKELAIFIDDKDFARITILQNLLSKMAKQNIDNSTSIAIYGESQLPNIINHLRIENIAIDPNFTNYESYQILLNSNITITKQQSIISRLKVIKNSNEINGAKKGQIIDSVAVIKFLYWLENQINTKQYVDELTASDYLLKLRKKSPNFISPSFETISAFASNGAIIHYNSNQKTNLQIRPSGLYLFDSGGQYFDEEIMATTDITRTILIGDANNEMINDFTRVLKGHINLARMIFPKQHHPAQIDAIARYNLWLDGKDYKHSTGHGVGSFLSVHEGPVAISKNSNYPLAAGMILSNEPGYYQQNSYGIRLENLLLVKILIKIFYALKP